MMRLKSYLVSTALLLGMSAASLTAAPREHSTINDAIGVLDEWAKSPETLAPPALLRDAHAVIIAPNMVKGGFVVAARYGKGILLVRQADGGWSPPVFVTLGGGSYGPQIGVQATDLFLIIRNGKSLDRLMRGNGKLTLGADISVAAGPLGRQASANTDAQLRAEILSYSRSRGVFAGVALEGDAIRVDWPANHRYYGNRDVSVANIVAGKLPAPESTAALITSLSNLQGTGSPKATGEPPLLPKP